MITGKPVEFQINNNFLLFYSYSPFPDCGTRFAIKKICFYGLPHYEAASPSALLAGFGPPSAALREQFNVMFRT